jgi:MFS family permease
VRPRLGTPGQLAALAGASILVGAYDQAAIGVALGPLRVRWHLSAGVVALVASAAAIGMVVGGLGAGLLAARLGRRRLLVADVTLLALAAIASALAPSADLLVAARLVGGVAVGVSYTIVFVYQRELDEAGSGSRWMAATLWAANFGMLGAYALGALLGTSVLAARTVLGAGALGALPLVLLRRRLPETAPVGRRHGVRSLRFGWADAATALAWFSYQVSDQGTNVLLPIIVAELGVASLRSASAASLVVKAVTIPASFATIWVVDRLGRRRLQLLGFLGRAVAFGALAFAALVEAPGWALAALLAIGLAAGSMGPDKTTVMGAAMGEDPDGRARAQGIAQTAGRLGGVVGPSAFVLAAGVGGAPLGIALFAASALVGWAVTVPMRS